jgi:hypothetical protein
LVACVSFNIFYKNICPWNESQIVAWVACVSFNIFYKNICSWNSDSQIVALVACVSFNIFNKNICPWSIFSVCNLYLLMTECVILVLDTDVALHTFSLLENRKCTKFTLILVSEFFFPRANSPNLLQGNSKKTFGGSTAIEISHMSFSIKLIFFIVIMRKKL